MWQVRRGYRGRGLVRLIEPRSEKGREREREKTPARNSGLGVLIRAATFRSFCVCMCVWLYK